MTVAYIFLGIVVVVIVAWGVFISTRPERYRVERSAQVNAPADVVFSLVDNFHQWKEWSPYENFDHNMKKTFEGPSAGTGAIYSWDGNNKAGAGRATILESKVGESISISLEMFRPFACTNQVTFTFAPNQAGTRVSWIMEGKMNSVVKAFSLFMSMDSMVGKQFEEGLANLNTAAQAASAKVSLRA